MPSTILGLVYAIAESFNRIIFKFVTPTVPTIQNRPILPITPPNPIPSKSTDTFHGRFNPNDLIFDHSL